MLSEFSVEEGYSEEELQVRDDVEYSWEIFGCGPVLVGSLSGNIWPPDTGDSEEDL